MKVLMVGVSPKNKGGMWTVVENYINNEKFVEKTNLKYISTITKTNIVFKCLYSFFAIKKVAKELKNNNYDIIHIHMSERGSVTRTGIIAKIAKKYNTKIVIHMHGAEFQTWYENLNETKRKKVRSVLNMADRILILGNYWSKFINSLVNDKDKINVLYNSVLVPSSNNYNSNSKNILFLGLVGRRKGIFDIIESIKILKDKNYRFKLLVYGPDETTGFNDIIENNGLDDYIEYRGWLRAEAKEDVFNDILVNLLPSYNEGLPMTILETMSYGIPNISTNVAAIPEVVNNSNGYLIEPGDIKKIASSIEDALNNDMKLKSDKAYTEIKNNFSLDAHIKKLLKIYESVIKE